MESIQTCRKLILQLRKEKRELKRAVCRKDELVFKLQDSIQELSAALRQRESRTQELRSQFNQWTLQFSVELANSLPPHKRKQTARKSTSAEVCAMMLTGSGSTTSTDELLSTGPSGVDPVKLAYNQTEQQQVVIQSSAESPEPALIEGDVTHA